MSLAEVKALEERWQKAFKAGDAGAVARLYTEDGRILPPNEDFVQGHAAIETFIKGFFAANARVSFSAIAAHESGDLIVAIGRFELELEPEPGQKHKDSGKYIEVCKRQKDGSLLIIEDMFNSSLPLA
jgi:uncharacterized protein (TIGR02246 family)